MVIIIITRHSLVRAKGEVFVLLYVCLFVCLLGQRFLDNPRADCVGTMSADVPPPVVVPIGPWAAGGGGVKNSKKLEGGLIRAYDSYHFYFSQRCQM